MTTKDSTEIAAVVKKANIIRLSIYFAIFDIPLVVRVSKFYQDMIRGTGAKKGIVYKYWCQAYLIVSEAS